MCTIVCIIVCTTMPKHGEQANSKDKCISYDKFTIANRVEFTFQ